MSGSDAAILKRWLRHRDAEAFNEIVQRHARGVYATCCRVLQDATEAEDVTQECFEALATADTTRAPTLLGPWLHGVATRRCLTRRRSEMRRREREIVYATESMQQSDRGWDEIYPYVDEAVADLPDELRVPLVAHFFCGLTHTEISRAMATPRRTIGNRIHRGLELIAVALKSRGITLPTTALAAVLSANLAHAAPIPATLTASLAKLAVAQSVHAPTATAAAGAIGIKHVLAIVAVVAVLGMGAWTLTKQRPTRPSNSSAVEALPAAQDNQPELAKSFVELPQPAALPSAPAESERTVTQGALSGKAIWRGKPVPALKVFVESYWGNGEPLADTVTDDQGKFLFEGLTPEKVTVYCSSFSLDEDDNIVRQFTGRSAGLRRKDLIIVAGETAHVTLEDTAAKNNAPEGAVAGRVLVDGRAIEHTSIWIEPANLSGTANSEGKYYLETPVGTCFVRAYAYEEARGPEGEYEAWTSARVESGAVSEVNFDIDSSIPTRLSGQFFGLRDGEQGIVVAFPKNTAMPAVWSEDWLAQVSEKVIGRTWANRPNHAYELKQLKPGSYTLVGLVESTFAHNVPKYGLLQSTEAAVTSDVETQVDFDFTELQNQKPVLHGRIEGISDAYAPMLNVYRGWLNSPAPSYRGSPEPLDEHGDRIVSQLRVGQERKFELYNVPPGRYTLFLHCTTPGLVVDRGMWSLVHVELPEVSIEPEQVVMRPEIQRFNATVLCHLSGIPAGYPEAVVVAVPADAKLPSPLTLHDLLKKKKAGHRVLDGTEAVLTGINPGDYTIVGFAFPPRDPESLKEMTPSVEELYALARTAVKTVTITKPDSETHLSLSF